MGRLTHADTDHFPRGYARGLRWKSKDRCPKHDQSRKPGSNEAGNCVSSSPSSSSYTATNLFVKVRRLITTLPAHQIQPRSFSFFFLSFFAIHKQCSSHSSSNARLTRHTKRLVQSLHMFRNQLVRATPQSARSSLHVLNACSGHTARKCRSCQLSTVFTCHAFPLTVLLSHRHSPQQTPPLFSFAFPPLNVPISNVRDVCPVCHVFSLDTYQSYPPHLSL